jgi:hypothetical protein
MPLIFRIDDGLSLFQRIETEAYSSDARAALALQ